MLFVTPTRVIGVVVRKDKLDELLKYLDMSNLRYGFGLTVCYKGDILRYVEVAIPKHGGDIVATKVFKTVNSMNEEDSED